MAVFKSTFAGGIPKYGKKSGSATSMVQGIQLHDVSVKLSTAMLDADDATYIYKFPADGEVYLLRNVTNQLHVSASTSALDSGSKLEYKVGVATNSTDGVVDTALIADCNVGNSSVSTDVLDATGLPLQVDGKYLLIENDTAATSAVSGTLRFRFYCAYGVNPSTDSSLA